MRKPDDPKKSPASAGRSASPQSYRYLLSAVEVEQFPPPDVPEVVFSGRSNVGKSSLINFLTQQAGLAKVSKTPGKTRAVNFFAVGEKWRLVDLPGYGYARLSHEEILRWGGLIDEYLTNRENLALVVQLIDSRHEPTERDLEMLDWLAQTGIPTLIALTKVDKVGRNEARSLVQRFRRDWLNDLDWPIVPTSVLLGHGRLELQGAIETILTGHELWGHASSWAPAMRQVPQKTYSTSLPARNPGGPKSPRGKQKPQSGTTGRIKRDAKPRPR